MFRSRWLIVTPALLATVWSFVSPVSAEPLPGLNTTYYTIDEIPPVKSDSEYPICGSEIENNINRSYDGEPYQECTYDLFMVHMTGFITIPEHQTIEFWLASDDGGTIKIGDTQEFGNWSDQGCSATESGQIDISAGSQPLDVFMYENGGGTCLMLAWNIDNTGWAIVPDEAFTIDYQQPVQTTIPDTTIPDTTIPGTTIPTTTSTTTTTTTMPETTTTWSTTTTSTTVAPTTVPVTNPSTTTTVQTNTTTTTIQVPTVTTSTSTVPKTTTTTSTVTEPTTTTVETTTTLSPSTTEESSTTTTTEAPTPTSTLPPVSNETSSTSSTSSSTTTTSTTSTTTTTLPPPTTTLLPPITTLPEPPQAPETSQPAEDVPLPPIADKAVVEALAKIEQATPAEVQAIVTELLAFALSPDQAVSIASEPAVLEVLTNAEAEQVFEQVAVEELTTEQAVELVAAVQEAPTKVRKAFEAVLNLFEGFADDYVMTNQNVPIKTRRALIALGAVFLVSAPAPIRRNR